MSNKISDEIRFGQDYSDYNEREYDIAKKITSNDAGEIDMRTGTTFKADDMFDPDWKLACIFESFLKGKVNIVPTFKFMDETFEEAKELNPTGNVVSEAYGLIVNKDCSIDACEMIRENVERHDVITADEYYAYENKSVLGDRKEINTEKYPRFDDGRIKHIQKFLNEYTNHLNQIKGRNK